MHLFQHSHHPLLLSSLVSDSEEYLQLFEVAAYSRVFYLSYYFVQN